MKKGFLETKEYKIKVPEKYLNVFQPPENINKYIEEMLPSLKLALFNIPEHKKEWIIGKFVIYILGKTKSGKLRYKIYNSEKYPTIPYYKWFLSQVRYFSLQNGVKQDSFENSLLFCPLKKHEEDEKQIVLEEKQATIEEVFDTVYINLIPEYLRAYGKKFPNKAFESNVCDLYLAKLYGETNLMFAARKGFSNITITKWMSRLEKIIRQYLNGDYVVNTI